MSAGIEKKELGKWSKPSEAGLEKEPDGKVLEVRKLFRRKPLLVEAVPQSGGSWLVLEAGREITVPKDDFSMLYELVETGVSAVDAGLPDLEPGTVIEKDGRKLIRVTVISGRGAAGYWHMHKPTGHDCGFQVVADSIDDLQASHRAGRFVEPFEGKPGTRTWVVVIGR